MPRLKFLLILVIIYCLSAATSNYFTYTSMKNYFIKTGGHQHLVTGSPEGQTCFCVEGSTLVRSWESLKIHFIIGLLCVCAFIPVQIMSQVPKDDPCLPLPS